MHSSPQEFLSIAWEIAKLSSDPLTKVGCLIQPADIYKTPIIGYNQLPEGIKNPTAVWADRELKLSVVIHAEIAALATAARLGVSLENSTLYLACTDDSEKVWGGPPCPKCLGPLLKAGVRTIITFPFKDGPSNWSQAVSCSREIIAARGISYTEILP